MRYIALIVTLAALTAPTAALAGTTWGGGGGGPQPCPAKPTPFEPPYCR